MKRDQKMLLLGATGLVGSRLVELLKDQPLLAPSKEELDITKTDQVRSYFRKWRPRAVIHCADFTDVSQAERERGDTSGHCWKVGVEGTRNIVGAAKLWGSYVIFFSTGSVFVGDETKRGPFKETDKPGPKTRLSWHAYCKTVAEKLISSDSAIVRISHPLKKNTGGERLDYLHRMIERYKKGNLYPLFTDQAFPVTWIDDLVSVLTSLLAEKRRGTFHVASPDLVTPYELVRYALQKYLETPLLETTTFTRFIKNPPLPKHRYSQYSALDVRGTEKQLGLHFAKWQEIVDRVL